MQIKLEIGSFSNLDLRTNFIFYTGEWVFQYLLNEFEFLLNWQTKGTLEKGVQELSNT